VDNELERISDETVMALFEGLFQHLCAVTGKSYKNLVIIACLQVEI
jgi:hypothetical protein